MARFATQRNGFGSCEEVRRAAAAPFVYGRREPVLCPKPRRVSPRAAEPVWSLRLHQSNQMEETELTATSEILNIMLTKDGDGNLEEQQAYPANLFGSPPTRTANPLVHDPHFVEAKSNRSLALFSLLEISPNTNVMPTTSPVPPTTPLRIEGFDCVGVSTFA